MAPLKKYHAGGFHSIALALADPWMQKMQQPDPAGLGL